MDCNVVSEAMRSHGGFPSTIFVREEMKAVWSILVDGITTEQSKWIIIGSPGVGKSVLAVLLCFHLARDLKMPVFLARKLKGEGNLAGGEAAICIEPTGKAVAYPSSPDDDDVDLNSVRRDFGRRMRMVNSSQRPLIVLDGWSQAGMVGKMEKEFGGFDLLATSAQYLLKGQDVRRQVLLPAWNDKDLGSLWEICGPKGEDAPSFEEQLYYSGGSARELLRPIYDIKSRIVRTIQFLDKDTTEGLLSQYGGRTATGIDTLRRCYLTSTVPKANLDASQWRNVVDSAFALNCLLAKAPLGVYELSLTIAMGCGPAQYGLMYEALVHKLFRVPNMNITFHVQPYNQPVALSDGYKGIEVGKDIHTECSGLNEVEAMDRLGNLTFDMNLGTYWHPDFPRFSVIDAVLFATTIKTVFYIQVTVEKEHDINCEKLKTIHEAAKNALVKNSIDAEGWAFKYVAVTHSQEQAENLELKDGGRVLGDHSVGEVSISKGYLTYAIK